MAKTFLLRVMLFIQKGKCKNTECLHTIREICQHFATWTILRWTKSFLAKWRKCSPKRKKWTFFHQRCPLITWSNSLVSFSDAQTSRILHEIKICRFLPFNSNYWKNFTLLKFNLTHSCKNIETVAYQQCETIVTNVTNGVKVIAHNAVYCIPKLCVNICMAL